MSRIPRIYIDNVCYHIITRGNQKQIVFGDAFDFGKYLKMLKKVKSKYEVLLYAYCLMPNHVHLLIDPKRAPDISKFMHWINRGYTAYFNTNYGKAGHLWQGRFRSKPIVGIADGTNIPKLLSSGSFAKLPLVTNHTP